MGAFSEIQAVYAVHRVATYPIQHDKLPAVRGYQNIGLRASQQFALNFGAVTAGGFCAGPRNRLTVIDIDSTDSRLVREAERRFGETPLHGQTPSGGWRLYYRNRGEDARLIRPFKGEPVDVLAKGNVVCLGSQVERGSYRVIKGGLDDLSNLPPLKEMPRREIVPKGERNDRLFNHCQAMFAEHCEWPSFLDAALAWNLANCSPSLARVEVERTAAKVWDFRLKKRRKVLSQPMSRETAMELVRHSQATMLYAFLEGEEWNKPFMIADSLADAVGWPRRLVPEGRKKLLELGIIERVRTSTINRPALYVWRQTWPPARE